MRLFSYTTKLTLYTLYIIQFYVIYMFYTLPKYQKFQKVFNPKYQKFQKISNPNIQFKASHMALGKGLQVSQMLSLPSSSLQFIEVTEKYYPCTGSQQIDTEKYASWQIHTYICIQLRINLNMSGVPTCNQRHQYFFSKTSEYSCQIE